MSSRRSLILEVCSTGTQRVYQQALDDPLGSRLAIVRLRSRYKVVWQNSVPTKARGMSIQRWPSHSLRTETLCVNDGDRSARSPTKETYKDKDAFQQKSSCRLHTNRQAIQAKPG